MAQTTSQKERRNTPPTNALSEDFYQDLKKTFKRKVILRWTFLIIGLGLIISSILAFNQEWTLPGLEVITVVKAGPQPTSIAIILPILMMYLGLWLTTRVNVNTNHFRENSFYLPIWNKYKEPLLNRISTNETTDFLKIPSIAHSRLIAALFPILLAGINMYLYGVVFLSQSSVGNWFVLGGPTLFYPLSLLPMIVAIGLMIYLLFSNAMITFSKTPHFLQIEEYRFLAPWITEIPRDEIIAVQITNGRTGAKNAWIFLLGFHIVLCMIEAYHYLSNPFTFGYGNQTGISYLLTAVVQTVVLGILVFKTQTFLEIITHTKRYELQIELPSLVPSLRGNIEEIFDIPAITEDQLIFNRFIPENQPILEQDPRLKGRLVKDWTNILGGIILIIWAISSRVTSFFGGPEVQIMFALFGIMLVIRGMKEDFSSPRKKIGIKYDANGKTLYYRKQWASYNTAMKISNLTGNQYRYEYRLVPLNFFTLMMGLVLPFLMGFLVGGQFRFTPSTSSVGYVPWVYLLMSFGFMILILYLNTNPKNTLVIDSPELHYEIPLPGTCSAEDFETLQEKTIKGLIQYRRRYVWKNQRKGIISRICAIIIAFVVGLIAVVL